MGGEQKIAFVTGARAGLGAAVARALATPDAGAGAQTLLGVRKPGDAAATVADIIAGGGQAREVVLDVTDDANIARLAADCESEFGRLDILVNNAATIQPIAVMPRPTAAEFNACMQVNVGGAFALTRAMWPLLKTARGRVVNLLSGAALQPLTGWTAYCASKAALLMLTRSFDLEGEADGIRCFGFAPGLVDTEMQQVIRDSGINQVSQLPRAALAHPDLPARALAWLASGKGDNWAGRYADVRDADFRRDAGLDTS